MTDAFATELVGSWCKPQWLADHSLVYAREGTWWRVSPDHLSEATDDAVRLAVADQDRAGLTYVTDGEQRRQTFSGHFTRLGGIDNEQQAAPAMHGYDIGEYLDMKERPPPDPDAPPPSFEQPRVVGPITWEGPMLVDDLRFLARHTRGRTKVTVIGPTTLALRLVDEHYGDQAALTFGVADALNAELRALAGAGADLIQIDEPEVHFRYSACREFAVEAIDRMLAGVDARTAVHMCYGYSKNIAEKRATPVYEQAVGLLAQTTADELSLEYEQPAHTPDLLDHTGDKAVILGVLNLDTEAPVETVEHIMARATAAAAVVGPDRIRLAPDCGMWFLPRDHACAKIEAMAEAGRQLATAHR
jgi:5-methyltetrahydropteroyltriglutamate--homocysteine methyltransferase